MPKNWYLPNTGVLTVLSWIYCPGNCGAIKNKGQLQRPEMWRGHGNPMSNNLSKCLKCHSSAEDRKTSLTSPEHQDKVHVSHQCYLDRLFLLFTNHFMLIWDTIIAQLDLKPIHRLVNSENKTIRGFFLELYECYNIYKHVIFFCLKLKICTKTNK